MDAITSSSLVRTLELFKGIAVAVPFLLLITTPKVAVSVQKN